MMSARNASSGNGNDSKLPPFGPNPEVKSGAYLYPYADIKR